MRYNVKLLAMAETLWSVVKEMAEYTGADPESIRNVAKNNAFSALDRVLAVLTEGKADVLLLDVMDENTTEPLAYCLGLWDGKKEAEEFKRKHESIISG